MKVTKKQIQAFEQFAARLGHTVEVRREKRQVTEVSAMCRTSKGELRPVVTLQAYWPRVVTALGWRQWKAEVEAIFGIASS